MFYGFPPRPAWLAYDHALLQRHVLKLERQGGQRFVGLERAGAIYFRYGESPVLALLQQQQGGGGLLLNLASPCKGWSSKHVRAPDELRTEYGALWGAWRWNGDESHDDLNMGDQFMGSLHSGWHGSLLSYEILGFPLSRQACRTSPYGGTIDLWRTNWVRGA